MLLGKWASQHNSTSFCVNGERTTLEFKEDGRLEYTIIGSEKDQKILLIYRVENNILITDQPSQPREERTTIVFTEDGKLILVYGNQKST